MEGLLSTGHTPSSFNNEVLNIFKYFLLCLYFSGSSFLSPISKVLIKISLVMEAGCFFSAPARIDSSLFPIY